MQFSLVLLSMSLSLPYTQDLGRVTLKHPLSLPRQFSVGLALHVVIVALCTGPGTCNARGFVVCTSAKSQKHRLQTEQTTLYNKEVQLTSSMYVRPNVCFAIADGVVWAVLLPASSDDCIAVLLPFRILADAKGKLFGASE